MTGAHTFVSLYTHFVCYFVHETVNNSNAPKKKMANKFLLEIEMFQEFVLFYFN